MDIECFRDGETNISCDFGRQDGFNSIFGSKRLGSMAHYQQEGLLSLTCRSQNSHSLRAGRLRKGACSGTTLIQ